MLVRIRKFDHIFFHDKFIGSVWNWALHSAIGKCVDQPRISLIEEWSGMTGPSYVFQRADTLPYHISSYHQMPIWLTCPFSGMGIISLYQYYRLSGDITETLSEACSTTNHMENCKKVGKPRRSLKVLIRAWKVHKFKRTQ